MDAMEDIHLLPGTGSKEQVPLLDGYTTLPTIACHILSPHVITTLPENMNHVETPNQHQNAKILAFQDIPDLTQPINGLLIALIQSHQTSKKSKLKS